MFRDGIVQKRKGRVKGRSELLCQKGGEAIGRIDSLEVEGDNNWANHRQTITFWLCDTLCNILKNVIDKFMWQKYVTATKFDW